MSPISEHSRSLWLQHEPFLINKVSHAFGVKRQDGLIDHHVYITRDMSEVLVRNLQEGQHIPNPWLRALRTGKNPAKDFLTQQAKYLHEANQKEIVPLADLEHPIRWAASGGLLILRDNEGHGYIPLTVRPEYAFYGNHLDAQGGLSGRMIDWLLPRALGLRELNEELVIVENGIVHLPSHIKNCNDDVSSATEELIGINNLVERQLQIAKSFGNVSNEYVLDQIVDLTSERYKKTLYIHFKGQEFVSDGLVIIDPLTGSLEVRNIYEMQIDSTDNLDIIDGEIDVGSVETKNRVIHLFSEGDLRRVSQSNDIEIRPVFSYQGGRKIESSTMHILTQEKIGQGGVRLTPVLQTMLERL